MNKQFVALLAAVMLMIASLAFAADSISGTIATVEGSSVTVKVSETPEWLKKGVMVKVLGSPAKVVSLDGDLVTVKSPKGAKLGSGATLTIEKHKSSAASGIQGC